jgi:hypothetical protein
MALLESDLANLSTRRSRPRSFSRIWLVAARSPRRRDSDAGFVFVVEAYAAACS